MQPAYELERGDQSWCRFSGSAVAHQKRAVEREKLGLDRYGAVISPRVDLAARRTQRLDDTGMMTERVRSVGRAEASADGLEDGGGDLRTRLGGCDLGLELCHRCRRVLARSVECRVGARSCRGGVRVGARRCRGGVVLRPLRRVGRSLRREAAGLDVSLQLCDRGSILCSFFRQFGVRLRQLRKLLLKGVIRRCEESLPEQHADAQRCHADNRHQPQS